MNARVVLAISFAVSFAMMGCAGTPPARTYLADPPHYCADVYSNYDHSTRDDKGPRVKIELKDVERQKCWLSSWEQHANYDLLSVEFDDQGWLADTAANPHAVDTQLTNLMDRLEALSKGDSQHDPRSLSIVLYTHGWHHSAAPNDKNVVAFRELLEGASGLEKNLCLLKRSTDERAGADSCSESEHAPLSKKKRHVVGIYVGWRGDSLLGPIIEDASIWDRKLAAEKVALGSVQEMYARIHDFYLKHTCHSVRSDLVKDCRQKPDVRLLTIGHSFGGLITYRSLAPRLMLGTVETHRQTADGMTVPIPYAYGFGDLTVLINPAFEGTRFEALAWAASHREYQQGQSDGLQQTAQLPYLIVAQSKGDMATHYAFPMFRRVTTLFESAPGIEAEGNIKTIGWASRYKTHELLMDPDNDVCGGGENVTDPIEILSRQAAWSEEQLKAHYQRFDGDLRLCNRLLLKKVAPDNSVDRLPRKPFMPLWLIQTDTKIIKDHNDFLNSRFVDFVWQIYYTILRADDDYMTRIFAQHH